MFYQTAIVAIVALSCFISGSTSNEDTTFRVYTFPTKPYSEDVFYAKPLTYVSKSGQRITRDVFNYMDEIGVRRSTSNPRTTYIPLPIQPGVVFNSEIEDSGRSIPVRPGYFPKEPSQRLATDLYGEKISFPIGGFNQKATIDEPIGDDGSVSQNFDNKRFSEPQTFGSDAALKNDRGSLYERVGKSPSHGEEAHMDTSDHQATSWVENTKQVNRRRRQIGPPRPPVYRPPPRVPLFKHRF